MIEYTSIEKIVFHYKQICFNNRYSNKKKNFIILISLQLLIKLFKLNYIYDYY